jgi:hypothetical protein
MENGILLSWDTIYASLIAVVIAIISTSAITYQAGLNYGKDLGRKEKARELIESSERDRYLRLYVPLERLFENHHLTVCESKRYPSFSKRMKRSFGFLARCRFRSSAIAIVDSGFSERAEFECGSDFPIDQVEAIISENLDIADQELRGLAGAVKRERFDKQYDAMPSADYPWEQSNLLTRAELSLLRYIKGMYGKLNSRFASLL